MRFAGCVGNRGGDVVFLFFHSLLSPFFECGRLVFQNGNNRSFPMEEKYKFFIRENEWKWDLLVLLVKIWRFIYVYNIKKVSPELSEKTSVCPCYHFCSFPARAGKPWEVRVIPLRYNRRACRCLKSMTLSSASLKPSSICSLHIPLSLQDLLSSSMGISL